MIPRAGSRNSAAKSPCRTSSSNQCRACAARRAAQARHWFTEEVRQGLLAALSRDPAKARMETLGAAVARGEMTPEAAAAAMLASLS